MNAFHPLTLLAPFALMLLAWSISIPTRNAAVADLFWGPALASSGLASFFLHSTHNPREITLQVLAWVWALRLSLYLFIRNRRKGEDPRYAEMRKAHPRNFALWSFFMVFTLQALLAWFIAWPLRTEKGGEGFPGFFDSVGLVFFGMGFFVETLADWQLYRFKTDPANRGKVMDRGLWRYSRHPNYFGESLLWWGLGAFALASGSPWALMGSGLITFMLLKVSGVPLLEEQMKRRGPEYAEYIRRTSAFMLWPPRTGGKK